MNFFSLGFKFLLSRFRNFQRMFSSSEIRYGGGEARPSQAFADLVRRRPLRRPKAEYQGIRTPGTGKGSTVFKTAAIDHSASSPGAKVQNRAELASPMLSFFIEAKYMIVSRL